MGLWKTFSDVMDAMVVGPKADSSAVKTSDGLTVSYTPAKADFLFSDDVFWVRGSLYGPYTCCDGYECGTASSMIQHLSNLTLSGVPLLNTLKNFATLESDYGVGLGG